MSDKVKIEIEFPFVRRFEFGDGMDDLAYALNIVQSNNKAKVVEVGSEVNDESQTGRYFYGVFYIGRRPSRKRIKELVREYLYLAGSDNDCIEWEWPLLTRE